ncbi:hypothetical protein HanXRQr2_Chr15g0678421 [Helianthus annuus]|uniref:Uncharacterized protein n=1 Tax=Helianthus annuus TaxID=4232 RepID=A0A9K3DZ72_HELAN|nr:hypothetical protein HanXRQr2_Chr15g0678421 [Helianthus annuus]KAJ0651435.1 hypothetical protein HanOQP8_Chr15g0560941 [Helianthus annuus]KAJ0830020.1 hypothetical protein HanPSC8_Chr15g0650431 [Helianthus annuus]
MTKMMVFLLLRSDSGSDGREDDGVSFVEKWRWRQRLGFRDVFWYSSCQTQVSCINTLLTHSVVRDVHSTLSTTPATGDDVAVVNSELETDPPEGSVEEVH